MADKQLLSLINNECDTLRNFIIWLSYKGEFSNEERSKIIEAVCAIDYVSIILNGHINRDLKEKETNNGNIMEIDGT